MCAWIRGIAGLLSKHYEIKYGETAKLLNAILEAMKVFSFSDFQKWMKKNSIIERMDAVLEDRYVMA